MADADRRTRFTDRLALVPGDQPVTRGRLSAFLGQHRAQQPAATAKLALTLGRRELPLAFIGGELRQLALRKVTDLGVGDSEQAGDYRWNG